ncbi:Fc receptor-like protein 5 [Labeo rohita]|uniref:Fc receptor-like protein 5 n=1 Tax=Labeo rohita TaxID=84645 RepID=A0ABQ8LZQ2_LABRO|nr:Fc receptor-like protein 5 [Labeo rohita]
MTQVESSYVSRMRKRPKPKVTTEPAQHVFRGDTVTLRCDIYGEGVTSWSYNWYKEGSTSVFSDRQEHTFSSVTESDAGKYSCNGSETEGSRWSQMSDAVTLTVSERPKPKVTIKPDQHVFRGDTVTLRCDIHGEVVTSWSYSWYKDGSTRIVSKLQELTISFVTESDTGKYSCKGSETEGSRWSQMSDAVTLTVSAQPFTHFRFDQPHPYLNFHSFPSSSCFLFSYFWRVSQCLKPALTVEPQSSVFTGDSVTLRCEMIQSHNGWEFLWTKDSNRESTGAATKIIKLAKVSDGGAFKCRARRGRYYTDYKRPKPKVTIKPAQHVFRGDTVTLRCDIYGEGVTSWSYSWYKEGSTSVFSDRQEHAFSSVTESDAGKYSCKGSETEGSRWSQMSDAITLTVSDPKAVLSVSPQKWLTEGDPVTLNCEVYSFSTGWTFSWFTLTVSAENSRHYNLLSDSSRGAGGIYTVSSAALNHTGVYSCTAEREKPAYKTQYSNTQLLWVTGVSPPVSLIVSPSRTQHFTSVSLSLSCEDQSNSTGWRVIRYTDGGRLEDCLSLYRGSQTGSTCTISSTNTSDTGVYWCESESGEKHHPVNITVHLSGVILESPVHPVTEGDHLILHCLYQHTTSPNLRADFYKDESLILNQTTEMSITTVSKSHEGFYYCKHPERGESPKSWISVRQVSNDHCLFHSKSQISVLNIPSSVLTVCPYLLVTVVLIFKCCRMRERLAAASEILRAAVLTANKRAFATSEPPFECTVVPQFSLGKPGSKRANFSWLEGIFPVCLSGRALPDVVVSSPRWTDMITASRAWAER